MPVRSNIDDCLIEVGADFPGGADDDRFAGHLDKFRELSSPLLPVGHDVFGQRSNPLRSAIDGIDDRHTLFDTGAFDIVKTDRSLIGGGVEDVFGDISSKGNLDKSWFKIDRYRCAVFD